MIKDDDIKRFVLDTFEAMSSYNLSKPASRNHHPPDEREEWGGAVHLARVGRMVKIIADGLQLPDHTKDVLLSAALLHDSCRRGVDGAADYTLDSHPLLVRVFCENMNIVCPDKQIFDIIETHMGVHGKKPYYAHVNPKDILVIADLACTNLDSLYGAFDE
jgi:hypothetical protein